MLGGAPERSKLNWNEKVLLDSPEITCKSGMSNKPSFQSEKAFVAAWRQITTDNLQMRPILPKLDIKPAAKGETDNSPAEFFSATDLISQESAGSDVSCDESQPSFGSDESNSESLAEYRDHSFSIHEAIPSSKSGDISNVTPGTPTYESSEEMFPTTPGSTGGIIRSASQRRLSQAPRPRNLTSLCDIPNAAHLSAIQPSTMTVNLIVGVLSISPARTIATGVKYGRPKDVDLVDVLVGDDTKTGFTVSMWLPREMHVNWKDGAHAQPEGSRSILRRSLKYIRPRDIVMIQNVALSAFRGKVHGQSLRGDVTKIDLLYRRKVGDDDSAGVYTASNLRTCTGQDGQIAKVKRCRDWLEDLVAEPGTRPRKNKRRGRGNDYGMFDMLPDDSQ